MVDLQGDHNIVTVFHALEAEIIFLNLTAMFDTFYQWVNEGVLPVESGHIAGDYTGDPKRVAEIAVQHNPGIKHWITLLAAITS